MSKRAARPAPAAISSNMIFMQMLAILTLSKGLRESDATLLTAPSSVRSIPIATPTILLEKCMSTPTLLSASSTTSAYAPRFADPHGHHHGRHSSSFTELCELLRIADQLEHDGEETRFGHLQVHTGQRVHLIGQVCDRLYAVQAGFLKTAAIDEQGKEQIMSFPMRGDLIGVDGLASSRHTLEAVALSDCELIVVPLSTLSALGRAHAGLHIAVCSVMARGLARNQLVIGMRAGLNAHARMARFLLYLAERHAASGYSANSFTLRMQRADIANYLSMAMETVSRTLSTLAARGLIGINRRTVWIKAPAALRTLKHLPRAQPEKKRARRG